ncbi:MAG: hypothetical protein WCI05_06040 [Myxococcales bacterium]
MRTGLAAAWGALVSVGFYAGWRAVQGAHPAEFGVPGLHIAFFWRALGSVYGGGLAFFLAYALARANPQRAAGLLTGAMVMVAAALVVQAVLFP